MKLGPLLAIAAVTTLSAWFVVSKFSSAESTDYYDDWSRAAEAARSGRKPILLNFGGPW